MSAAYNCNKCGEEMEEHMSSYVEEDDIELEPLLP